MDTIKSVHVLPLAWSSTMQRHPLACSMIHSNSRLSIRRYHSDNGSRVLTSERKRQIVSSLQGGGAFSSSSSSSTSIADTISSSFPILVISFAILGIMQPSSMTWIPNSLITWAIGFSMLGMGLTLTFEDFTRVLSAPQQIMTGVVLQYTVMPSLAFIISRLAQLPLDLTIGLCIVGACPGGTASNIVTYLAKADVPLSVAMTTASTLGAVFMTPFLTSMLLGTLVQVDGVGLLLSTLQVVLFPVLLGCTLNQLFPRMVSKITPYSTVSAVLLVACICGRVMASNSVAVMAAGVKLVAGIFALHAGGFFLGYTVSKYAIGVPEKAARTNSIEVGMQNSALGAMLATQHFGPMAAVPCAISACLHSLLGSILAWYFSSKDADTDDTTTM